MDYSNLDLIAPDSFWKTLKEEVDKCQGGCGPGKKGDYLVPDKIFGISITEACRIHDWEYYIGETKEDKRNADFNFLLNMLDINYKRSKNRILRMIRDHIIFNYFLSVYYCGDHSFFKNKE